MNPTTKPWRTSEQFLKVYEYVYSEDIAKKRWAVEQMDEWEARSWPALPFPVEATLYMVRANIQDLLSEVDKSLCLAREVEMMYATAIIRFTNLILEKDKAENLVLAEMAERKNIPTWIVDIRHSATHGICPTLPVLRMAYKTIMQSLETLFWAPESARISLSQKTFDAKSMVVLLQEYRTIQHQNMKSTGVDKLIKKALRMVCEKISRSLNDAEIRYEFVQMLVHPDNFVTKEDINCLNENDKKTLIEDSSGILPKAFRDFWNPLLNVLHKHDCIQMFLELLLFSQENRTIKIFQKIADYLVLYILNLKYSSDNNVKKVFLQKGPIFNYYRLLYACMKGSSDSTKIVFDKLSAFLPLGGWTKELFAMLSIRQGLTVIKEGNKGKISTKGQKREFDITFTVGDLDGDITEIANRRSKLEKNRWFSAPISTDVKNMQVGYVLSPVEKERKDDKKKEIINKKSVDDSQIVAPVTEESMPVEQPKLTNFIFQGLPAQSYMIYRKRNKK